MHYYPTLETIAALATPPGEGGIAVVRISGEKALDIAEKIFSGPVKRYQTHTAHFGKIIDRAGHVVDEALLLPMLAPKSYTGENVVEIHCHGGSLISRRVLDTVLSAGARAALPGEFTFRAFLNGKLDLAQAEAVQELIGARNELALRAAEQQLRGSLSQSIQSFQKQLVDIAAILEAWVDFPEEDLEFASLEEIASQLEEIRKQMQKLHDTFHEGKVIHEGLNLCLIGSPNVGKSSLMNALLGKERAIVTEIPGTTRDLLEEEMRLGGLHFRLIDTAGIRDTAERIEQEGIRRSKQAFSEADLILLVLDASRPLSAEDEQLLDAAPADRTLLVWNKIDLAPDFTPPAGIRISAKLGWGLDDLREAIERAIWHRGAPSKEEILITNVRHNQALQAAILSCGQVIHGLRQRVSPEFLSSDMRATLSGLGAIIGTDIAEDILNAIFSKFCIGK